MSEASGEIWIAVLSAGWHVLYEEAEDESGGAVWKDPLFIEVEEQESGQPGIIFRPLCVFGNNASLQPIDQQHIMYIYRPAEDIVQMRDKFLERYQAEMESMNQSTHNMDSGNGGRLQ